MTPRLPHARVPSRVPLRALVLAGSAGAWLSLSAAPAFAADPSQELSTAATHAGMAAEASNLQMVHAHLQHVVNCLVGPSGQGFDAKQLDPCKGQGEGAITDAPAGKRSDLQKAVTTAQAGIADSDLTKAKAQAKDVQAQLAKASK